MHPENAIDNGDFIKILVYKFILGIRKCKSLWESSKKLFRNCVVYCTIMQRVISFIHIE